MRPAKRGNGIGRGVWVAHWAGPNWETILVAVRRDGRMLDRRVVARGEDHVGAADELWAALDRDDPEPVLRVI